MNNVHLMYQGKPHRGLLAISTKEYPRFYWFFPLDPKLALAVGECLSFKAEPDAPLALTQPCPSCFEELAEAIRFAIQSYLAAIDP